MYWLLRLNKAVLIGSTLVITLSLVAALAPYIAPYDPTEMHPLDRFSGPSTKYLLGTDFYGRDVLSRIIYGLRTSLQISFLSVLLAVLAGGGLGILAGYFSWLDNLIMRVMDVMFAFPVLLLAITIVAILGPGEFSAILAIAIVYVPIFSRVARGPTLAVREETYVEAAQALGASHWRIIAKHVLPNISVPMLVQLTVQLASAIIFESALSFLGLGTQPPLPSLGLMVSEGRPYLEISPWSTVFPGVAIALVVLGFNLLGDGLQQALNPQLRKRRG